mmetsp:Transcript_69689/g.197488  ORF Transcript_69689/g.197488 Transcript_69689/m.197488 type:complete len:339 (-) Transcript_69689:549-1565(-)
MSGRPLPRPVRGDKVRKLGEVLRLVLLAALGGLGRDARALGRADHAADVDLGHDRVHVGGLVEAVLDLLQGFGERRQQPRRGDLRVLRGLEHEVLCVLERAAELLVGRAREGPRLPGPQRGPGPDVQPAALPVAELALLRDEVVGARQAYDLQVGVVGVHDGHRDGPDLVEGAQREAAGPLQLLDVLLAALLQTQAATLDVRRQVQAPLEGPGHGVAPVLALADLLHEQLRHLAAPPVVQELLGGPEDPPAALHADEEPDVQDLAKPQQRDAAVARGLGHLLEGALLELLDLIVQLVEALLGAQAELAHVHAVRLEVALEGLDQGELLVLPALPAPDV